MLIKIQGALVPINKKAGPGWHTPVCACTALQWQAGEVRKKERRAAVVDEVEEKEEEEDVT